MKIEKLLFVTKFDQLCFNALQSLLTLRQAGLRHVVFVYVIERDQVAMHRGAGYRKSQETRLREKANIRFIDWAEALFEQGMEVGVYIVVGGVVSQVIKAAAREAADLIVIGRSQKGALANLYAGSDVTEIIRRVAAPTLVYKHLADQPNADAKPFARPLVATDGSPASLRAVDYLKTLGSIIEQVNVVSVVDENDLTGGSAMAIQKTRKDARRKLEDICDRFEDVGISARAHVYVGQPAEELSRAALECRASMIVAGSSAKNAWVERWIGSVPRTLAEKSDFPTLLFPPEGPLTG